jgi:hypothetical protein
MGKVKETLGSRKFLVTLSGVIVVVANEYFGWSLNTETVLGIVTMVASYVIGQGYVDGKRKESDK